MHLGTSACTTGLGSMDLEDYAVTEPHIGIANCLAARCAGRARHRRWSMVEDVVERREIIPYRGRTELRKRANDANQKEWSHGWRAVGSCKLAPSCCPVRRESVVRPGWYLRRLVAAYFER